MVPVDTGLGTYLTNTRNPIRRVNEEDRDAGDPEWRGEPFSVKSRTEAETGTDEVPRDYFVVWSTGLRLYTDCLRCTNNVNI